jgi:hypothetical protein
MFYMSLYPGVFYIPVLLLQCDSPFSDFFYKVIVVFCVLQRLKGDCTVCVYCYCSWDVIVDVCCACFIKFVGTLCQRGTCDCGTYINENGCEV